MKRILTVATIVVVVGLFFIFIYELGFRGEKTQYETKDNYFNREEPVSPKS